jgi:hypothetical protein
LRLLPYFCIAFVRPGRGLKPKFLPMEHQKKNKGIAWLVFFISFAALIFAIYSHWPWLTLILPFMATSFVWAMDIM